jgi:hypothetical protein
MIRSTVAGAALGALVMVVAVLGAVWATGYLPAFARDRGFLQLVLAIPLACLATAAALTYFRVLSVPQLFWAMLPVEGLILLVSGVMGLELEVLPWTLPISAAVFVPWIGGALIGRSVGRSAKPPP